jgi:hypothetical protein
MLTRIEGYWMAIIAPGTFTVFLTLDPLPLGTNVYANISLSDVNTLFSGNDPDPKFAVNAVAESFTFYNPDGTQSAPQRVELPGLQNAIAVQNCATITFTLHGSRVAAVAQVNIFTL